MNFRYLLTILTISTLLIGCGDDAPADDSMDAGADDAGMCLADALACTDDADCCSLACEANECVQPFSGSPLGASCVSNGTCNSGNCNTGSGVCVGPSAECADLTDACEFDWECCSGNCGNEMCTSPANICYADAAPCNFDVECCNGACEGNFCTSLPGSVGAVGDPCDNDSDCGSGNCQADVCVLIACDAAGEPCAPGGVNTDCCSGTCSEVSGECGPVPEPADDGELCDAHWQCASDLCNPYSGKCEPMAPPPV